jgi:hypothetical protein
MLEEDPLSPVRDCLLSIFAEAMMGFFSLLHLVQTGSEAHTASCLMCKGEGNVPVLLLTEHHAMKAYWGSGGIAPLIL